MRSLHDGGSDTKAESDAARERIGRKIHPEYSICQTSGIDSKFGAATVGLTAAEPGHAGSDRSDPGEAPAGHAVELFL
jgi:hypothetical protein